jgi:hypothetical protein
MMDDPELTVGSTGTNIKALQEALAKLNYQVGGIDGNFGPLTQKALLAFQVDNNLPLTGAADSHVLAALSSAVPRVSGAKERLEAYRAAKERLEAIYRQMQFKEAISTFSSAPIMFLMLMVGAYASQYIHIISNAFADTTFVAPLGLSQQVFTSIVIMMAVLFAALVCGLFWAGFVAKPKSPTAATVVQHLVTFRCFVRNEGLISQCAKSRIMWQVA